MSISQGWIEHEDGWIEYKGKMYPRISKILKPFNDFSHIDPKVLANKCRIGTSVHQAIADDIEGEFPCPMTDGVGYFDSYEAWKFQINPTFLRSEVRYFDNQRMLTGQIDALIDIPNKSMLPTLVDFKTSAQESRQVWPMQAHLYGYLLSKNGILVDSRYLFVKLNKYGNLPDVFEYTYSANVYAKCINAVDDFWKNNKVIAI